MSTKYKLERGQKYLACLWRENPNYMIKTKGFKDVDAARRWIRRILEVGEIKVGKDTVTISEIGLLTKNKRDKSWPWAEIERHKNPRVEQIKQARRRMMDEERSKKR